MKSIHRWIREYSEDDDRTFYGLIKAIQEDAYNQGIEDAVNNAECYDPPHEDKQYVLDRQSILKLKK